MNPRFLGDSYDIVKRFLCVELRSLDYGISIDAMFTGTWPDSGREFFRLLSVDTDQNQFVPVKRSALFLDPDTGINHRGGRQHMSFEKVYRECGVYDLVFSFDQSFSSQATATNIIKSKLATLSSLGAHGMYYDSHARFLFASKHRDSIDELRLHLISLGLPEWRLPQSDA